LLCIGAVARRIGNVAGEQDFGLDAADDCGVADADDRAAGAMG